MLGLTRLFVLLAAFVYSVQAESSTTDSSESSSESGSSSKSSTASQSPTLVWVTSTINANSFTVFQSPYYQNFPHYWTDIASPKSGSIGLGRLNGTVGGTRQGNIVPSNDVTSLISSINADLGTAGLPYPPLDPQRADKNPITSDGVVVKRDQIERTNTVSWPTGEPSSENAGNSATEPAATAELAPTPEATS